MKKIWVLQIVLSGIILAMGLALGGLTGVFVGILVAALGLIAASVMADRFLLRVLNAQPVGPCEHRNLFGRVQVLARLMGLPEPRVFVLSNEPPATGRGAWPAGGYNAMALGSSPARGVIVVTPGLLNLLSDDELNGVLAHLLSQILQGETQARGLAVMVAWGLLHFVVTPGTGWFRRILSVITFLLFVPPAAGLIRLVVQPGEFFEADQLGAKTLGSTKGMTAALLKLEEATSHQPLMMSEAFTPLFVVSPVPNNQSVLRLFQIHPPTESRVEKLSQLEVSLAL